MSNEIELIRVYSYYHSVNIMLLPDMRKVLSSYSSQV